MIIEIIKKVLKTIVVFIQMILLTILIWSTFAIQFNKSSLKERWNFESSDFDNMTPGSYYPSSFTEMFIHKMTSIWKS